MTPVFGFAPDADKTTPGLIADCSNLVPCQCGMEGAPSPITPSSTPAFSAACTGAAVVAKLDDTRRIIAGTSTKLYELLSGVWEDVSRVGDYVGGAEVRWSITQFGDATLATNKIDEMQRSTGGDFADISGAPKADIIFSVGAFVMALNVNDGAEKPDGWHCCAQYDDTDWTPSITTQATSGRLVATAGRLTAGMRLGEYAVAYKQRSIYLGQYVGAPAVWDWTQVAGGDAGCVGKEAICDIGGIHFFVGDDNFWVFDGTRPVSVADGLVRDYFYQNSNPSFRYKTICVFDRQNNRVWVFYASNNAETPDSALVYHLGSKRWGKADMSIEAALNYVSAGMTIDGLDDEYLTIDSISGMSFDSQYWLAGGKSLAVVNTSHQLQMLTGDSESCTLTTGDVGDDDAVSMLTKIRLRYAIAPQSATVQASTAMGSGEDYVAGSSGSANDGKFDVRQSARWHKATFTFTGLVRITHMDAELKAAGGR